MRTQGSSPVWRRRRILPLILLGLWEFPFALATNYYVSPTGSDGSPGTLTLPFQTIQKAASIMVAGDTAYIRAGTYRETVTPANSGTPTAPIRFLPYNGESVIVSGADVIAASAWILSSGNIWKAPVNWDLGVGMNQVFLDSQMMIEARWPNTTLDVSHPITAQTSGGSFVGPGISSTAPSTATVGSLELPSRPAGYWNGAMINISMGPGWAFQSGSITDSPAGNSQLSFTFFEYNQEITPSASNPFYLWGKLSELDTPDEWFLDGPSSTLYFWPPASDSPAQHVVEARRRQFAFVLNGRSFITIQGLNLFAGAITSDNNSQYLVLDGLNIQYPSHYSVNLYGYFSGQNGGVVLQGANNVLSNSTVSWTAGYGVMVNGNGSRVFNNVVHDAAYNPTGDAAIIAGGLTPSDDVIIAWNTLHTSGREGVILDETANSNFAHGRIMHNQIFDYGIQTNDLGCTYTGLNNGNGTEIAYNLCHDNRSPSPYGGGIYLDNNSSNYVVHHNVAWNVVNGIQLTSGGPHYVFNNTLVAAASSLNGGGFSGTVVENNILPIFSASFGSIPSSAVASNNILPGTTPQFVDPANMNYQLLPSSPAVGAGLAIPPFTDGYSGSAPDIGAYDHAKPAWKAGAQAAAYTVSAVDPGAVIAPGSNAIVSGTVPFDSGVSVMVTDGAGADISATVLSSVASPPQLVFQVPATAALGVAMIAITNGDGTVSLSSAPIFPGNPFTYSGQSLTANGGSGSINFTFPTNFSWTASSSASWVTITGPVSGVGSGTLNYQVASNTGVDRSATITIDGYTFTIEQEADSISGASFAGSMPHLAAEGGWTTTFTFLNVGAAPAVTRTSVFAPDGTPLTLPFNLLQQPTISAPILASSLDQTIEPGALFVMQATGPGSVPYAEGSAQLAANGAADGFAIFHFNPSSQEAVVPLEKRNAASYLLSFDNTNSVVTGVAIENVSSSNATIPVVIRDDTGKLLLNSSVALNPSGHTSLVLSTTFPQTADLRGTAEFDTPGGGQISVLGIRYTPPGTLTTIPALANVTNAGGAMAHLAVNNGWQTTFVLVNTGASVANATLSFFDNSGNPLPLPLTFPQGGIASQTASTLTQSIAASASLWVTSVGGNPAATVFQEGSAQLTTNGNVSGFVIFRYNVNGQEAVVPLESRDAPVYLLAFDNTNGTATGVAVSNASTQAITVPVTLRDGNGNSIGTGSIALNANGHSSFNLATQFPATAGILGTVEFAVPSGATISVLGIRSPPALTFTTLPPLVN